MKKYILLTILLSFILLSSCSNNDMVELQWPATLFDSEKSDPEMINEFTEQMESKGFDIHIDSDGKYILTISKKSQKTILSNYKRIINDRINYLIENGDPALDMIYRDIQINKDFSSIDAILQTNEQMNFRNLIGVGLTELMWECFLYQVFSGQADASKVTVNVYDETTNLSEKFVYPDDSFENN